jgi:phosphoribosylanthranilate isomerase
VIKAAQVATAGDIRALEVFRTDFHLLDAAAGALRGGSGRTWEWGLLADRRSKVPLILSGGLGPDNVAEAIAAAHPWAVDSASGTEAAPGVKDPEKVRRFLEIAAADGAAVV